MISPPNDARPLAIHPPAAAVAARACPLGGGGGQIETAVSDEERWLTLQLALTTHNLVHTSLAQLESRQEQLSKCKPPEPATPAEHAEACKSLVQWCLAALPVALQADLAAKLDVRQSDNPNEGNAVCVCRGGRHQWVGGCCCAGACVCVRILCHFGGFPDQSLS